MSSVLRRLLAALAVGSTMLVTVPARSAPPARWEFLGPRNIGGRVNDLVIDPHTRRLYAATSGGGVWTSADGGLRWRTAWGRAMPAAVGALAVARSGAIYAGTGEAFPGNGNATYGGNGVYRSDDHGRSWRHLGLSSSERIGRIAIDPRDSDRVFVAATGPGFRAGGGRGLWRSIDGGRRWTLVLPGDNSTTGAVDVVIDPADPRRMFATMWDRVRQPDHRAYFGVGSGLFRSVDGGATWRRIGLPYFAPNPGLGRMAVEIAPSDPRRVYVVASSVNGANGGFYVSSDGGDTFRPQPGAVLADSTLYTGAHFGRISVDPRNPDHVLVGLVSLLETTSAGAAWTVHSHNKLHVDHQAFVWDPANPDRWWVGGDAGVFRTDDAGDSFSPGVDQPWTQLYSVDVAETDPRRVVGGGQDTGELRSWDEDGQPTSQWEDISGGTDGMVMRIDPTDENVVYMCAQYGWCQVSYDGGNTARRFDDQVIGPMKNWVAPFELHPRVPHVVYTASEFVHRSTDQARTWEVISPRLTGPPGRETNGFFYRYGSVTTLAPAGDELGTIYAGTDDGRVWVTRDDGASWKQLTGLPTLWVNRIRVDPRDPSGRTAYVALSGLRVGDATPYLYLTRDGGTTWTRVSQALPPGQVNDVAFVFGRVLVATDTGVLASRNLRTWTPAAPGLPLTPVTELRLLSSTPTLYASTFGRGTWRVRLQR
ncbi:MAG TPA: hypothetical protein VNB94_13495 [Mycobacteriales bacterium]|nr:hypothetical protein [Mycobacteriales bacterium]